MSSLIMSSQVISTGDENTDYAFYSSVLHSVILTFKALVLGLLQITPIKAEIREPTLLCFLPFSLIYFILLVCEVKLRRQHSLIHQFVARVGHFFGAIAANILVSLISPVFALVVAIMCLFWFLFVVYNYYVKHVQDNKNTETTTQSDDQILPV